MKLFLRILAILAAALVVVGITYALNQGGLIGGEMPAPLQQAELTGAVSASGEGGEVREFRERGGEDEGGAGLRGLADVTKSLVIVSVIVALFTFFQFVWLKARGKMNRRHATPEADIPV